VETTGSLSLRRYGASPGSHSHAHFQILLGLSGALDLEIDGRSVRVAAGGGCVIEPGAHHDFESRRGSLCLVLDSNDAAWMRCSPQQGVAPPAPALTLANYLAQALQQGRPLAQAHGPALLQEAWLAGHGEPATGSLPPRNSRRRSVDWLALQQWAAQQDGGALTVADLAQHVHLSVSQLAARCRAEQGIGVMAWLRTQRLVQARLWRDSGVAVAEVARRVGYHSPSALTAALRRQTARTKASSPADEHHG
jgi:AraC-like DNA-binding protein